MLSTTKDGSLQPRYRFRRIGRAHHLDIHGAEDLRAVLELDAALWVATSAPIESFRCDNVFLDVMDIDSNGRIRTEEVRQAIRWLLGVLRDPSGVAADNTRLELAAVDPEHDDGRRILSSARKMLRTLGDSEGTHIDLDQVREIRKIEESQSVSEAGVVLPEHARDDEVRSLLRDILDTVGGEPHPSGSPGVSDEQLERFLEETEAHLAWLAEAEPAAGDAVSKALPLGQATAKAWDLYTELREKIDQYFALDRAVRFDPRFESREIPLREDLTRADVSSAAAVDSLLAVSTLAAPRGNGELELEGRINPIYGDRLAAFRDQVLRPLLGDGLTALSERHWRKIVDVLAPHGAWLEKKPETRVAGLAADRLRRIVEDPVLVDAVRTLIRESENTALVLKNVRLVERAILYQAYLVPFANNFVSFPDLYDPERRALFDIGDLVMDGRHYNMCIQVPDHKKHVTISSKGNMFVIYVVASSIDHPEKVEVALPVTSGGRGNLYVGKQGVFYHVDGYPLDAEVVEIVENPISFSEALTAPFRRLGQTLTGKIEALTSVAEKKLDTSTSEAISGIGGALKEGPKAPAAAEKPPVGSVLAGGGIAVAALSSSAAFVIETLSGLDVVKTFAGVLAAMLAVMVPVSIVAYLKLRRRDLSTLLEGSGWGINARMRLSRGQIRYFTHGPIYPPGARGLGRRLLVRWLWGVLVVGALAAMAAWLYFRSPASS